jgi:signal transduction histidine kinase
MSRRPSLARRVALAVVGGFALVFVTLLVVIGSEVLQRETGEYDRALLNVARSLAGAMDGVRTPDEARSAVRLLRAVVVNQEALLAQPGEPPVLLAVATRQGEPIEPDARAPPIDLAPLAEGLSLVRAEGKAWRVYAAAGRDWKVAVIDDDGARQTYLLRQLSIDLALYLAIALPLVLLPVWWIVRRAMAPLQALSDQVAARSPSDLSPLPRAERSWRELEPLRAALDRLFERVARSLARERAFVHDAAHELRTPLAVVAAQAHLVRESEGAARTQAHQRLQAAVERASHLAQQLLRLAQADAVGLAPRETIDLMDLARDVLAAFAPRAEAQRSELALLGPDAVPWATDRRALQSVLENLVDNALHYGGPGGEVRVTIAWEPGAGDPPGALRIAVADLGPGIPHEERERVFERFWRGRQGQLGPPGAGLGLAIVREAVRALGGDVGIEDGAGGAGVVFVVRLPRS